MGTATGQEPADARPLEKGLKTGAIGFASSVVIGVASTAPGYSLAAVLGLVVAVERRRHPRAGRSSSSPFIPMLLVAMAYKYLNKADPDAGTTLLVGDPRVRPEHGLDRRAGRSSSPTSSSWRTSPRSPGCYSFLLFGDRQPLDARGDG